MTTDEAGIARRVRTVATHPAFLLGLLTVAGLLLRVWYILDHESEALSQDGVVAYHDGARRLVAGEGFATYSWAPGWTFLLTFPVRLGFESLRDHQFFAALLSAGAIPLVAAVGSRLGGRRVAAVAAVGAAVFPHFVIFPREVLSETPAMIVLVLVLWLTYRLVAEPRLRTAILAGLGLGVLVLIRADAVLLAPMVLLTWIWSVGKVDLAGRIRLVGIAAITTVAVVLPWSVHVSLRTDRLVPVATSSGRTLLVGACDATYSGERLGFMELKCVYAASLQAKAQGLELTQPEVDAYNRERWSEYTTGHLTDLPRVVLAREGRMLGLFRPGQTVDLLSAQEHTPSGGLWAAYIGFWLAVPLGVIGAVSLRRRSVPVSPLLAPAVSTIVMTALTFGYPRYRFMADIGVVLLAAVGVVACFDRVTRPDGGPDDAAAAREPAPAAAAP